MSLAAAVPYVLAYEDQMQSAASSRVPAHAQIGQHQQNRGVSWVLACHGCWQASLSCQQRRWVIASSRVQCLPAPRDTFFVRDSKNVSLGAGMLACTGAGNCSKTGCDPYISPVPSHACRLSPSGWGHPRSHLDQRLRLGRLRARTSIHLLMLN